MEPVESGAVAEITRRFQPVGEMYEKMFADYSDDDLERFLDFQTRANELSPKIIEEVRALG